MDLTGKRIVFLGLIGVSVIGVSISGCENQREDEARAESSRADSSRPANMPVLKRWYDEGQVLRGNEIYQANCASCHKNDASGTEEWKKRDINGKFPPPPINGTAHAWHHSLEVLRRVINKGGIPLGGSMPAFESKLDSRDVDDVLAWVQSNWSDEIYSLWYERNQ